MLFDHAVPSPQSGGERALPSSVRTQRSRHAKLALTACIALFALAEAALADADAQTSAKRKDHPLSLTLWSPPPQAAQHTILTAKARWDASSVPFILRGNPPSFKSPHNSATSRSITAANHDLYEGTLHIHGDDALGNHQLPLNMHPSATLSYAPGAILYNALQVHPGSDPAARAVLRVDHGSATQVGIVLGNAPIIKQGAGTLYLADAATSTALTTINQGTLSLDQSFWAGAMQVNRHARLEGQGSINAPVSIQDGGVLAPGLRGAPGRLLLGNLTMAPGATLEIRALPDGTASDLYVMQTAHLAGHVRALAQAGDWQAHTRYTIIQAGQSFDGTRFDGAYSNLPFLDPVLSYDDHHVYLSLVRNQTPLEEAGDTPTEDDVADAVDQGGNPDVHDALIPLDRARARQALNQLSGNWGASIATRLLEDSRYIREAALRHARSSDAGRGNHPGHGMPSHTQRAWAHAFHAYARRGADHGIPADTRDTHGLVMGWTHPLADTLHASAYLGLQQSRMDQDPQRHQAKIASRHLGLALSGVWRSMQWITGAAYTWHALHHQRSLSIGRLRDNVSGSTRGRALQLFTEILTPLRNLQPQTPQPKPPRPAPAPDSGNDPAAPLAQAGVHAQSITPVDAEAPGIMPFARLAWVQQRIQGYTEHGGPTALNVGRAHHAVLFSTLGLKATHTVRTRHGTARLLGEAAWRHATGDLHAATRQHFRDDAGQRRFTSTGQAIARHAWALHMGMEADVGKRGTVGIAYDGLFARRQQDHGARLNVAWVF